MSIHVKQKPMSTVSAGKRMGGTESSVDVVSTSLHYLCSRCSASKRFGDIRARVFLSLTSMRM
jgi:hypothetical protein